MPYPCRSCAGFNLKSYLKDDRNIKMLDERLEDLIEQYKKFKKNLELEFEMSRRPELTGNYLTLFLLGKREGPGNVSS